MFATKYFEPSQAHGKMLMFATLAMLAALMLGGCASDPTRSMIDMDAKELLENARNATSSGNFDKSIKFYDQIEARYPYSVFSRQALLDQAYNYYQQSDDVQALATIDRFLRLYPNQTGSDYAYYLRGLIQFGLRRGWIDFLVEAARSQRDIDTSKQAYAAFNQVATQFPQSPYAEDAKVRMGILYNQMGQYEVNLAKFYFERDAFVASATRANLSLQNYPRSQSQEEALAYLAASYHRLDLNTLRDDTFAILKKNYPNTTYERFIFQR